MDSLFLIEATPEYAKQVWQFRQEVLDCDSNSESHFAGCLSLDEATSAEKWIHWCQLRTSAKTCKQTGVVVPSTTYFAIRKSDDRLVGIIDLRHHINHPILGTWGGLAAILFDRRNVVTDTQRKCCGRISVTQKSLA